MKSGWLVALWLALPPVVEIRPLLATDPVSADPDDPAVWVNRADPARSLILGTNKVAAPQGSISVFGLDGKTRQTIRGLDRPNNIDVEYGLPLGGESVDLAVATERFERRLRVYRVDEKGLRDIGSVPVFQGQSGEAAAPMGIALYKRPRDGAVFAIVGRKTGPRNGYLWQYRLEDNGKGRVRGVKVREFGRFSGGMAEIEAIAVDDELGHVYYADEGDGIHKYNADPDAPSGELAHFGRQGFRGDREGIAIYARPGGKGYVVCTDQIPGSSEYRIYPREGVQSEPVKIVRGGADSTDGLEIASSALGPRFPHGLMVAMNSGARNFLVFPWEMVAATGQPKLP
ncbi:MAG: phytase [Bryobacteraceae bacterium]